MCVYTYIYTHTLNKRIEIYTHTYVCIYVCVCVVCGEREGGGGREGNTTDFCMLILNPATLMNLLVLTVLGGVFRVFYI